MRVRVRVSESEIESESESESERDSARHPRVPGAPPERDFFFDNLFDH